MALTSVITHADSLIKIFQLGKSILDFGEQAFNIVRATVKWFTRHHQEYLDALLNLRHYYRERDWRLTSTILGRMRRLDEIRPQTDFDLYDAYVQAQSLSLPRRQPLLLPSAPESDSESDAPKVYYRTLRRPVRRLAVTSRRNANREERDSDSDTRTNVRLRRRNQPRPRAVTSSATMNSVNDSNNSSQGNMYRQPCNAPSWYRGSNIAWADENGFATDGDGNVM